MIRRQRQNEQATAPLRTAGNATVRKHLPRVGPDGKAIRPDFDGAGLGAPMPPRP